MFGPDIIIYLYFIQVHSIGVQNKTMGSTIKMAEAMKTTADTMKNMNHIMKPEQIAANAREFQQGISKINMTDEMSMFG